MRAYVLAYPALLSLAFAATWVAGRLSLGHWPRASLDDPKSIGIGVDVPYLATLFLMMAGLPAFAVSVLVLLGVAWREPVQRWRRLRLAALAITFMVATIAVLRWDPWRIVEWFMD